MAVADRTHDTACRVPRDRRAGLRRHAHGRRGARRGRLERPRALLLRHALGAAAAGVPVRGRAGGRLHPDCRRALRDAARAARDRGDLVPRGRRGRGAELAHLVRDAARGAVRARAAAGRRGSYRWWVEEVAEHARACAGRRRTTRRAQRGCARSSTASPSRRCWAASAAPAPARSCARRSRRSCAHERRRRAARHAAGARLRGPGGLRGRARPRLRTLVDLRLPGARRRGARHVRDRQRRRRAGGGGARRRRRAARALERLPPPRDADPVRHRALPQGAALPLPRLDVPPGRPARGRPRGAWLRRARPRGRGAADVPRRVARRPRLRLAGRRRAAARRVVR